MNSWPLPISAASFSKIGFGVVSASVELLEAQERRASRGDVGLLAFAKAKD